MSEHILVSFFSSTKNNKLYIFSTELIHDICYLYLNGDNQAGGFWHEYIFK